MVMLPEDLNGHLCPALWLHQTHHRCGSPLCSMEIIHKFKVAKAMSSCKEQVRSEVRYESGVEKEPIFKIKEPARDYVSLLKLVKKKPFTVYTYPTHP